MARVNYGVIFLLLLALCPPVRAAGDDLQATIESALQPAVRYPNDPASSSLRDRMAHYGVPAVSVAVVANGTIAWAQAYGVADTDGARPATPATLFQAASISKPVSALAVLRLVEQGKFSLDDDINRYLKRWQIPANRFTETRPVTARLLLSHRAGTTVHGFPGYAANVTLPTLTQILLGEKPANTPAVVVVREPGKEFDYSGGGTTIMQMAVEDALSEAWETILEREVLRPLGMSSSTYSQPLPSSRQSEAASGHGVDGITIAGRYRTHPEQAAAGLWTTSIDLCKYLIGAQRAIAGEPGAILSRSLAGQMVTAVGDGTVGLGPFLTIEDGKVVRFGHGGSNQGFRAGMIGTIDGAFGASVLTNSDNGAELADEILRMIALTYHWPGRTEPPREAIHLDGDALDRIVGDYGIGPLKLGAIFTRSNRVFVNALQGEVELIFESPTKFFNPLAGIEGSIEFGDKGVVTITATYNGREIRLRKLEQPRRTQTGTRE